MSVNAAKEMLAGYADPDAGYPNAGQMLLNLNTGKSDTDANLYIRICPFA